MSTVSSSSGGRGLEPRPQTHFDASTGLKTHLVTASFSSPNISYDAKCVIPPGFRRPGAHPAQQTDIRQSTVSYREPRSIIMTAAARSAKNER